MKWEEATTWLMPVKAWVDSVAQAEDDPAGTRHKTQAVYQKVIELASEIWLDNEMEEGAQEEVVDLDLEASHGRHQDEEATPQQVSDIQGEGELLEGEEADGGGGAPDLLPSSDEEVSGADKYVESD